MQPLSAGMDIPTDPPLIRAVTFDLDDTLYDFQACMREGAVQVVEALRCRNPRASRQATVELFHQMWHEATAEAEAAGGPVDWPSVRKRGIERLTMACDCCDEA